MPSLLRLFRRPDYQSETTQFIDKLKAAEPELEARQRAGRALLWDKQVDREAWQSCTTALRLPDERILSSGPQGPTP